MSEQWGPGDRSEWSDHGTVLVGDREVPLIYGEHPHSRRDSRHYALLDPDREPVGFDGHRPCMRFDIRESNYLKTSGLSGDEVRKSCEALVYMNNRLVFGRSFRTADFAMRFFLGNMYRIEEHPVQLWRRSDTCEWPELIGRKVYWRDQPGVIRRYFPDQGAAVAEYDGDGPGFVTPAHRSLADVEEVETDVKDDILSESWGWLRE